MEFYSDVANFMNSAMLDGERKEERELTVGCYVYTYTFVKLR